MNFHRFFILLWDILFPRRCPVCDGVVNPEDGRIHPKCRKKLFPVTDPFCYHCGRQISSDRQEYCSQCRKKKHPFTMGRSLFSYQGAVKEGMYRFKYGNKREYAVFFAEEAVRMRGRWLNRIQPECIIPVPMYAPKKKARGYNQAESFAVELSRLTGIPIEKQMIFRNRSTKALKLLNPGERERELHRAFSVYPSFIRSGKKYDSVLIVDDIYTTGSTAGEMASLLHSAGVGKIYILTVCSARGNN